MYAYIKGTIAGRNEAELIVDNNGVGYLINCPLSISAPLGGIGDEVKVFVYQSVKEDDISLYGFAAQEQKDMFLKLITVSGIGPKVAHSICACLEPEQFAAAVMSNNVSVLTGVKGLGKKTAERIILELKDKLKAQTGKSAGTTKLAVSAGAVSAADGSVMSDAVGALLMLGFKEQEATESVASAYTEGIGLEELIKKALKLASGSKLA
ncbi:MAG: Holliday junction branch migration protein RuvA [Clostridiales bacterium]|nr:Holliday junction branch migration protein RuvA [Clostridiales bacterium]